MKRTAGLLLLCLLLLPSAGCSKKEAKKPKEGGLEKVRFGALTVTHSSIPIYLGLKKGFFAEQGVDLQVMRFTNNGGGSEAMTAAAAGEIDAGTLGTPILIGAAAGIPVKVVGSPAQPGNPFILLVRPGIKNVAELKGKKVSAGKPGNGTIQAFNAIARGNGLTLADIVNVDAGASAVALASLQSGKIDGVITTEMSAERGVVEGFGKVLCRAQDFFGRYQHSFIFASQKFIDQKPEVVRGLLAAYRKAVLYAQAHPEETIQFGVKELELDEKTLRAVLAQQLPSWNSSGAVDLVGTNNAIKILKELGEIDKSSTVTAEQLVDGRFLPK